MVQRIVEVVCNCQNECVRYVCVCVLAEGSVAGFERHIRPRLVSRNISQDPEGIVHAPLQPQMLGYWRCVGFCGIHPPARPAW